MHDKGPILMRYIPIKPTVAGNVASGHTKFPGKELGVYEMKLAAFFRARAHQQMPDSPTLALQLTLQLDALNGPAEHSEMFIVGFDEAWLVQDKSHNCPITGRHLSAKIYWAAAEYSRSRGADPPPALLLGNRCQINMIMSMKPWCRRQTTKGGRTTSKPLPALCFSKNAKGIELASTLP